MARQELGGTKRFPEKGNSFYEGGKKDRKTKRKWDLDPGETKTGAWKEDEKDKKLHEL